MWANPKILLLLFNSYAQFKDHNKDLKKKKIVRKKNVGSAPIHLFGSRPHIIKILNFLYNIVTILTHSTVDSS